MTVFFLACGFVLGMLFTFLLVALFWMSETRRFNRRYKRPDEHATHYTYYGNGVPRERKGG